MTAEAERKARKAVLAKAFAAMNARDFASLRATLHPEANWPDTLEGGRLEGREAVIAHFERMFALLDPNIQLVRVIAETPEGIELEAQLLVRDHKGHIWSDTLAHLTYSFRDDLISDVVILSGV